MRRSGVLEIEDWRWHVISFLSLRYRTSKSYNNESMTSIEHRS